MEMEKKKSQMRSMYWKGTFYVPVSAIELMSSLSSANAINF
jgi:hypothetical protein